MGQSQSDPCPPRQRRWLVVAALAGVEAASAVVVAGVAAGPAAGTTWLVVGMAAPRCAAALVVLLQRLHQRVATTRCAAALVVLLQRLHQLQRLQRLQLQQPPPKCLASLAFGPAIGHLEPGTWDGKHTYEAIIVVIFACWLEKQKLELRSDKEQTARTTLTKFALCERPKHASHDIYTSPNLHPPP